MPRWSACMGRRGCTSLPCRIICSSAPWKCGRRQKHVPDESPSPLCSTSTAWMRSCEHTSIGTLVLQSKNVNAKRTQRTQCQNTISPGLTSGTLVIVFSSCRCGWVIAFGAGPRKTSPCEYIPGKSASEISVASVTSVSALGLFVENTRRTHRISSGQGCRCRSGLQV